MAVAFTKMHGLGNDFVVFDATLEPIDLTAEQVRWIAQRRFGVGCDQVLVLEPGREPGVDFSFRIFNADGGEVGQCGNGVRCLARFVRDRGLTDKSEIRLQSLEGVMTLTLRDNGAVTADMGIPEFEPARIPFAAPRRQVVYDLDIGEKHVQLGILALGNPHAVQVVDELSDAIVASEGPLIENHPRFPESGKRRVHAGARSPAHTSSRARARRRRDAGMRVGGVRGSGFRSATRVARRHGRSCATWWQLAGIVGGRG